MVTLLTSNVRYCNSESILAWSILLSSHAPVSHICSFKPSIMDAAFQLWSDRGITAIKDLCDKATFMYFMTCQPNFNFHLHTSFVSFKLGILYKELTLIFQIYPQRLWKTRFSKQTPIREGLFLISLKPLILPSLISPQKIDIYGSRTWGISKMTNGTRFWSP